MIDEFQLELENRIKNLMWTVSGDYSLEFKPDLDAFVRSKLLFMTALSREPLQNILTGKPTLCIW